MINIKTLFFHIGTLVIFHIESIMLMGEHILSQTHFMTTQKRLLVSILMEIRLTQK